MTAATIAAIPKNITPTTDPSVDSLFHPWFTTTNLSYSFPIFETPATALCGTTGMAHTVQLLALQRTLTNGISISLWKRRFLLPIGHGCGASQLAILGAQKTCNGSAQHRQRHTAILAQAAALLGGLYRGTGRSKQISIVYILGKSQASRFNQYLDDNFWSGRSSWCSCSMKRHHRECRCFNMQGVGEVITRTLSNIHFFTLSWKT